MPGLQVLVVCVETEREVTTEGRGGHGLSSWFPPALANTNTANSIVPFTSPFSFQMDKKDYISSTREM